MSTEELQPNDQAVLVLAEEVDLETKAELALKKVGIDDKVLAALKEKAATIKIKDFNDKEGFKAATEFRKDVKRLRILGEKACKEGREEANKIRDFWVEKQRSVVEPMEAIEETLEIEEKKFKAEQERIKEEEKNRIQLQAATRAQDLIGLGAFVSNGTFILGDAVFEVAMVNEADEDLYHQDILPEFQKVWQKNEDARLAKEKEEQERQEAIRQQESDLKAQQEKLEADRKELEEKLAEQHRQEDEKKRQAEEESRKAAQVVYEGRVAKLEELGMVYSVREKMFKKHPVVIHDVDVHNTSDENFESFLGTSRTAISDAEEAARKKKEEDDAEVEKKRQEESDRKAKEKADADEKERQRKQKEEEDRKAEELLTAGEKKQWEQVVKHLKTTPTFDMHSGHYRLKMKAVREFLATIK